VPIEAIGAAGGSRLTVGSSYAISLTAVAARHAAWLPGYMAAGGTPG
jgi:hypothetical protein